MENAITDGLHRVVRRCPKPDQSNSGLGQGLIHKAVPPPTMPLGMRSVIQFNGQHIPGGAKVTEDEVKVLLGYGCPHPATPAVLTTGDDIRQTHLAHDQESARDRLGQWAEEGSLAPRQQGLAVSVDLGATFARTVASRRVTRPSHT